MVIRELANKSIYGTIGYISSQNDIDLLEQYVFHNLDILKEFKQIVVATNYKEHELHIINKHDNMWKKYFSNCILITSEINRGHNHGYTDLDNLIFDWCKENNEKWLCKASNDMIYKSDILNKEINEADFYYFNGISYEDLYLNKFDYQKVYNEHFYPQTNFYFINVLKCDYLNDKIYLDETYHYMKTIPNYNGKIWEYVPEWSCENFLKKCVSRNRLSKEYLLDLDTHNKLCETIKMYKIGDPSHKNIMYEGVCHFQFPEQNIIEI
jgi:hypothetical protein